MEDGAAFVPGEAPRPAAAAPRDLPWVRVSPGAPYFETEDGEPWHPVGQNDAITWPDFRNLFRRRDLHQVEGHIRWLRDHGVTVLRLMLEYAQGEHRYLEKPPGRFAPNMVRLWDDLFAICARRGMRMLLTPYDTFWMWIRWGKHPYNARLGGVCDRRDEWLVDRGMLDAAKARLSFAVERWGGSGVVFAWDLWNEMHPAHMRGEAWRFEGITRELSTHVRDLETRLYGRSHPQTVSLFGPILYEHPVVADTIFRHPLLDFATTHLYAERTIDWPRNTWEPAVKVGELVREAVGHCPPARPYLDSEHGPIHLFKDKRRTLGEEFDDEYFRHIQWAHLASGGAGGGMRWPNRTPHVLTHGMRRAQAGLARFLPLIDWGRFGRLNLNAEVAASSPSFARFACGDARQAVAFLLRTDAPYKRGRLVHPRAAPLDVALRIPGLEAGRYEAVAWDTREGRERGRVEGDARDGWLHLDLPGVATDVALAIRPR